MRLPTFRRVADPPAMHFTQRDSCILETTHAFDGMLGDYQVRRLYFTGERQCRGRLSLLFQHGYLARPTRQQRAGLPCMVYWLARRGAEHVAGLSGVQVRALGWRREPRWGQIEHDLAVNDFRLDVTESCARQPELELETWVPEREFLAHADTVMYTNVNGRAARRQVRPDGLFTIRHGAYRSRLLLELDRATEDNPRFVRQKVLPGLAYLRSSAFQRRAGYRSGRWLVVTTGERRMHNLRQQTVRAVGTQARVFWFTTFDLVTPETVLTASIWTRGDSESRAALVQGM